MRIFSRDRVAPATSDCCYCEPVPLSIEIGAYVEQPMFFLEQGKIPGICLPAAPTGCSFATPIGEQAGSGNSEAARAAFLTLLITDEDDAMSGIRDKDD